MSDEINNHQGADSAPVDTNTLRQTLFQEKVVEPVAQLTIEHMGGASSYLVVLHDPATNSLRVGTTMSREQAVATLRQILNTAEGKE